MNATSIDAGAIQRALVKKGYAVTVDGKIGPKTRKVMKAAVVAKVADAKDWSADLIMIAFEQIMMRDAELYAGAIDGAAGPQTRAALADWARRESGEAAQAPVLAPVAFAGAARRIDAADIVAAAKSIGCEVAALRAVMSVESRGSGFDARDRPIILFEPHVFYRQLARRPASTYDNGLNRAVIAGLAYKSWRRGNYPGGSALHQSDGNYDRLSRAIEIHEESAFRAISMGMGQVLGENFDAAGHASAREMFIAAADSEAAQLAHMLGYIKDARLDDDIRARRWSTFARGYNGNGQVVMYADRLADAYRMWA